jgi:hypothetical protein
VLEDDDEVAADGPVATNFDPPALPDLRLRSWTGQAQQQQQQPTAPP